MTSPDTRHIDSPRVNPVTDIQLVDLGMQDYDKTWQAMKNFTEHRNENSCDELWLVEHPPVYTMGLAAKKEHILHTGDIPVMDTDRGGQVTYHGPGQIIIYFLLDIKRRELGVKNLVKLIERSLISLLEKYELKAHTVDDAPGVYIDNKKIAALGLRIKRKGCYHGLSLNVDMDLSPFQGINPCGYPGLEVIQLKDLNPKYDIKNIKTIQQDLVTQILHQLDEHNKTIQS